MKIGLSHKMIISLLTAGLILATANTAGAAAAEPSMADYTSYPVFMSGQVEPNIMVILDNSGSMNSNAYGSWWGDDNLVKDEPYECGMLEVRVTNKMDDSEETAAIGDKSYYANGDLDIGFANWDSAASSGSTATIVGIRFNNIPISKGATITNAYIEFVADKNSTSLPSETKLYFKGEATDHAQTFVNETDEIQNRKRTTASVTWSDVPAWTYGNTYQSPDLSAIVQEIIDRDGWGAGQAMAFIITADGKRDARPYDDGYATAPKLHIEYTDDCKEYYGYFDPNARYSYSNSIFSRDSAGKWSGNFLNWLTMRRIDVARKVLMGGLANPRTYSGTQKLNGHDAPSNYTYIKGYDGTNKFDGSEGLGVTPYDDGEYTYTVDTGEFIVKDASGATKTTYKIVVEKVASEEPRDFADLDGAGQTTVGVFQRYGTDGRWGNMWFNNNGDNANKNANGGVISNGITDKVTSSFVNDLQNTSPSTYTPLAEALYTAAQYYAQKGVDGSLNYANNPGTTANDPFVGAEYCAKNFVLLITDGASTKDSMIPASIKNYADAYDTFVTTDIVECDESTSCKYGTGGTDYLKDVALWARTNDLRDDIESNQNVILYTVYAFGNEDNARELLKEAAKNGGFKDLNDNGVPDGKKEDAVSARQEWDENGDGLPDTYFEAQSGSDLEKALGDAIAAIKDRASSGTASSVLATNSEGEATLLQAFFKPKVEDEENRTITWAGYMHSLWVDYCGNLREDTDGDHQLDLGDGSGSDTDLIVQYYYNSTDDSTYVRRYNSHPAYGNPKDCDADTSSATYDGYPLDEVASLFEAGEVLANTAPEKRNIFTFVDQDDDDFVDSGEIINFDTDSTNAALLDPYLAVEDAAVYDHLGASHTERINNLINYIRGVDLFDGNGLPVLRNRTIKIDGELKVWKLGDIVHSTPIMISKPTDNYNVIYSDESYQKYYESVKDRESIVLVGANDGMLHAFTSWKYEDAERKFVKPAAAADGEVMGTEIWAYIPQSLLPHLKWLSDPDYTHVYYVDLQAKVFDAKILPDSNSDGELEWGTFLLLGLNMGGKNIWSNEFGASGTDIRYFNPSYTCINITNPRKPEVLWERDYGGLGLATSVPGILKVGDAWMAVFGSGPTNYDGTSTQNANIYVVDLITGTPASSGGDMLFTLAEDNAFLNSPVSVDKNLNYNVDGIYFGETYCKNQCDDPGNYQYGVAYKVPVPCTTCDWDGDGTTQKTPVYEDNPTAWPSPVVLLESDNTYTIPPITRTMSLSTDTEDNVWVYFGTGRFIDDADKTTIQQNYLFGVKDPFFNSNYGDTGSATTNYFHDYSKSLTLTPGDLFNTDEIVVTSGGKVFDSNGSSLFGEDGNWSELISAVREKDGWRRSLEISIDSPSERCISKPGILGGLVLTPAYTPSPDVCDAGGTTSFYGLYYETGTAYKKHIFNTLSKDTISLDGQSLEIVEVKAPGSFTGSAPPTSGIHVGRQDGAKAFVQLSTGEVLEVDFDTAVPLRSNIVNWRLGD